MKPGETPNPPVESCLLIDLIVGKIGGTNSNGTLMLNTVLGNPHH